MLVIKLTSTKMFVKEIGIDGKVSKTYFIDDAKKFEDHTKTMLYVNYLMQDGYGCVVESVPKDFYITKGE